MTLEIADIQKIRKKLGFTQFELAKRAQVSQSLIAKIESGKLDPTYSNAKKIFNALDDLSKKQEIKAEKLMTSNIISIEPKDNIKGAIKKMKQNNISQLPVVENNRSIGLVSETTILEAIMDEKGKKIKDIMQDAPPVVSKESSIDVISNLLKFYPMILVSEEGELKGVITKSDLIEKLYK